MPAPFSIQELRCEFLENPLGIDVSQPHLSWKLVSDSRAISQSAYQIRVTGGDAELWDSGKVGSDQSVQVAYAGPELQSGQHCTWQVRAWDANDQVSEWSKMAWWEMGLLKTSDWHARWIEPAWDENPDEFKPSPYLRTTFKLEKPVASARIYATAHGLYELSLNGQRVGDAWFTPGYTSYLNRLQYQVYDVGELLQAGENAIGAILGDGWYRGSIGAWAVRNFYGKKLGLLLQLVVRYEDGSEDVIVSDKNWQASTGPILKSDLQAGETYDARKEMPGWNTAGFAADGWQNVQVADYDFSNLVATIGAPVRRKERFVPKEILTTPNGETVVDMGQNFSGAVELRVSGPAGTTVRLQHGETFDKDGNFTLEHLGLRPIIPPPSQLDEYTLKGEGEEVYTPRFTTHGFRYVKVEGFPGTPAPENFTGIAIYSDLPETGTFSCSDPLINQLQHNILWSQKSNFLEIPTDCPTRERAGWTGDAQVFVATGSYLMQTDGFFTKWLKDLAAEQEPGGRIPNMIPSPEAAMTMLGPMLAYLKGATGWGDAAVIVPWMLYQAFGDRRILEEQYPSMKAWVEYLRNQAQEKKEGRDYTPPKYLEREPLEHERYLWDTNYHWGEWFEPNDPVPGLLFGEWTPEAKQIISAPHIATAYYAYSTSLLAQIALVLGKDDDAQEYANLLKKIKAAYVTEFIGEDGHIAPEKQANYVRALAFDLVPEHLRPAAAARLAELVREAGTHLGTGFLSTPYLCPVLADNGYLDLAYELLLQTTPPSWLYSVKKGSTTIWETWEGINEQGEPNNSLNHYSYGAIGNWLYRAVAGIIPAAPGYKHILIRPRPGGGLSEAGATYQSVYGEVTVHWQLDGDKFSLEVTIPASTTATVVIPAEFGGKITETGRELDAADGISRVRHEPEAAFIEVGSGKYNFSAARA